MGYMETVLRLLGVVAGLILSGGIVWKVVRRPVKYVYGHLFGDPVGAFLRAQVKTVVVEQLQTRNGGTTVPDLSDRLDRVADRLDAHIEAVHEWQLTLVPQIGAATRSANDEQTRKEAS